MKKRLLQLQALPLLAACFLVICTTPSHALDRKEVISRARQSYYSLRGMGLLEFQSSIKPAWEITLADQIRTDPDGAQRGLNGRYNRRNIIVVLNSNVQKQIISLDNTSQILRTVPLHAERQAADLSKCDLGAFFRCPFLLNELNQVVPFRS